MKIISVAGAPSDIVQAAALHHALAERAEVEHVILWTGRSDDAGLTTLCDELEIPRPSPACCLDVDTGSHGVETGLIMQRLEPPLAELGPDTVLVYGAANAAPAAALVAAKLGSQVGHVEAGLRTRDWTPDEINRVVTDRLADPLFVPSRDAIDNLDAEGVAEDRIHFVGSMLIDTLCRALPRAEALDPAGRRGLARGGYALAALRQPAAGRAGLVDLGRRVPVVELPPSEPLGYLETLGLVAAAGLVVTDSGALQEATSYLGVPCLTVGPKIDRPSTCLHGTNRLVSAEQVTIVAAASRALARRAPVRPVLERWDGGAAERIVRVVCDGAVFPADAPPAAATAPQAEPWASARPEPALLG